MPSVVIFLQAVHPQRQEFKSMQLWTAMWAIFEGRGEVGGGRWEAAGKLAKAPNRYVCAAEGCGIATNTGKVLPKCGLYFAELELRLMATTRVQVLESAATTANLRTVAANANER